ncbi:MAG TPA: hypothetical protein VN035_15825 [Microbacterium sp.]|nr:hypothetical protein [Microbacterium sp.]
MKTARKMSVYQKISTARLYAIEERFDEEVDQKCDEHGPHPRSGEGAASSLVVLHSLVISIGLVLVAGMLLAATAFSSGTTIAIPMIATFHGFSESGTSPGVTITGSWGAAIVLVAAVAAVLSTVIIGSGRRRAAGHQ